MPQEGEPGQMGARSILRLRPFSPPFNRGSLASPSTIRRDYVRDFQSRSRCPRCLRRTGGLGADDLEVPVPDVGTIQVRRRWGDAHRGVGRMASRRGRSGCG